MAGRLGLQIPAELASKQKGLQTCVCVNSRVCGLSVCLKETDNEKQRNAADCRAAKQTRWPINKLNKEKRKEKRRSVVLRFSSVSRLASAELFLFCEITLPAAPEQQHSETGASFETLFKCYSDLPKGSPVSPSRFIASSDKHCLAQHKPLRRGSKSTTEQQQQFHPPSHATLQLGNSERAHASVTKSSLPVRGSVCLFNSRWPPYTSSR
ncbi:uncharacterized protein UHOD_11275 [Ustilago sp. UG-2017b]|nr:uncharacterized protein UHOD_11275 [Ustilago sp. UG-2017b]